MTIMCIDSINLLSLSYSLTYEPLRPVSSLDGCRLKHEGGELLKEQILYVVDGCVDLFQINPVIMSIYMHEQ